MTDSAFSACTGNHWVIVTNANVVRVHDSYGTRRALRGGPFHSKSHEQHKYHNHGGLMLSILVLLVVKKKKKMQAPPPPPPTIPLQTFSTTDVIHITNL